MKKFILLFGFAILLPVPSSFSQCLWGVCIDYTNVTQQALKLIQIRQQVKSLEELTSIQSEVSDAIKDSRRIHDQFTSTFGKDFLVRHARIGIVKRFEQEAKDVGIHHRMSGEEFATVYTLNAVPEDPMTYRRRQDEKMMSTVTEVMASISKLQEEVDNTSEELHDLRAQLGRARDLKSIRMVQARVAVVHSRQVALKDMITIQETRLKVAEEAKKVSDRSVRTQASTEVAETMATMKDLVPKRIY